MSAACISGSERKRYLARQDQKLIFFAVAYILWDTANTICDVPVFGLVTTMTDIQNERTSLMTTGRIWANIGVLVAMMIGYLLPS